MAAIWVGVCSLLIFHVSLGFCADLYVTHKPEYVALSETERSLGVRDVPDLVLSVFGLTPRHDFKWDGLQMDSLFKRPKANLLMMVEGVGNGGNEIPFVSSKKYSLDTLQGSSVDVGLIGKLLQGTFPESTLVDGRKSLMDFVKSSGTASSDLPTLKHLDINVDVDKNFVDEIQLVFALANVVLKDSSNMVNDAHPDMFAYKLQGYRHIVNKYGDNSDQAGEARNLLATAVARVTKAFRNAYQDSVMVEVLTTPAEDLVFNSRKGRSLKAAADKSSIADEINLATDYDENFPAMFNIILWTMLLLAVALFGISYCMWNMDNGRDSIYMMTTPRLKKE